MTTVMERWQLANDEFLAKTVEGLRGRLEALARKLAPTRSKAKSPPPPPPLTRLTQLFSSARTGTALPPGDGRPASAGGAEAAELPAPALMLLARRLGLTEFERDTLMLCVAMELDTRVAALCAQAQGDDTKPFPTFALAFSLFERPSWDALSPDRPLRGWRLLEIHQGPSAPLVQGALRADERIVNYIKGLNHLDERLGGLVLPVEPEGTALPPSQQAVADAIADRLTDGAGPPPLVQLLGPDGEAKRLVAERAAMAIGGQLHRLPADGLPTQPAELDGLIRLWQRETMLLPLALLVDATRVDRAGSQGTAVQRLLGGVGGVVFLDAPEPWPEPGRDSLMLDVAKPTAEEQCHAWAEALGGRAAARLAGNLGFNLPAIRRIAAEAVAAGGDDPTEVERAAWTGALARLRPGLNALATAIAPKARWEDLVLPGEEKDQLRRIIDQACWRARVYDEWGFRDRLSRGLGITALFAGDSGTGKTMAAEVIAGELGLPLYRVDLSAVVSKYIGETEKNLRRLFDAAEDGGAILFFDEADALFGKRSEVKDSHDRYANIEVNYLLQRMEGFRGVAILATNMKAALDAAFLRRLRFVVTFPFPGPAERAAIWRTAFPARAETEGLDYEGLGRLNLTGGSIQVIALNAAFLAAREGSPVRMAHLLASARAEFRKLERPVNEAEFRRLDGTGRAP